MHLDKELEAAEAPDALLVIDHVDQKPAEK